MKRNDMVARVAIMLPIDRILDYRVPLSVQNSIHIGTRVLVPLGKRTVTGYIIGFLAGHTTSANHTSQGQSLEYRDIQEILDEEPLFDSQDLSFFQWVSQYYFAPLGEVIRTALPVSMNIRSSRIVRLLPDGRCAAESGLFLSPLELDVLSALAKHGDLTVRRLQSLIKKAIPPRVLEELAKKGLLENFVVLKKRKKRALIRKEVSHTSPDDSLLEKQPSEPTHALTHQQQHALDTIRSAVHTGIFSPFLLHGVTGSGKTEVYIRAIEEALKIGKEGLVLVPEIALTPQTVRVFSDRLKFDVTVLHSGLSQGERLTYWWRIRKGEIKVAIGARSAIFAPFRNLGVIVIDEEHDPSYKQEDRVRYHARDLALVRAKQARATVILGSATPSLESYYNAHTGKFSLLELTERVERRPLPEVTIVNMTDPVHRPEPHSSFSPTMLEALAGALRDGKQGLLFLNRRGFSHTLVCRDCGFLFRCPNCSITLTFHLAKKRLCCHYCEHQARVPNLCPGCQGNQIQPVGRGTERIEKELEGLLHNARITRMDRDTTSRKGSHDRILRDFREGKIDVLIGTQMIAKGHDIPGVTFVGVVSADVSLDLPDFRAAERTFHLLTQVAGRAGRGPWPGKVLIQTLHPDNYSIQAAKNHDYKLFYSQEITFRKELNYPPYSRMINIGVSGTNEEDSRRVAVMIAETARTLLQEHPEYQERIQILGPSAAPLARLRRHYRFQCFIKGTPPKVLNVFTRNLLTTLGPTLSRKDLRVHVDVDPIQVL